MDTYTKIAQTIKAISGKRDISPIFTAKVKSVSGTTCTIDIGTLTLSDVRLRSVINDNEERLLITPKNGSQVLVADLSNGNYRDLAVISYSEIEKIEIKTSADIILNDGNNGGLINITSLVQRLNGIENSLNILQTAIKSAPVVAQDGGASFKSALTAAWADPHTLTQRSDLEDSKVKH